MSGGLYYGAVAANKSGGLGRREDRSDHHGIHAPKRILGVAAPTSA